MKYLVTGVNGQLGYDIVKKLKESGIEDKDIIAVDVNEMDITKKKKVEKLFLSSKPDVIFHCAAWTNVDKAEECVNATCDVNINGTKFITDASIKIDAKLIYVSTDYVFDGTKNDMYTEIDIPNPQSVYGATKFLGEMEVKRNPKHFITRVSWVFGINGHNFVKTMLKLAESKSELSIVDDQVGSPTYTVDLASVLVDLSNTTKFGTYHVTNEGFCSWADFAEYIFKSNDIDMKINRITSDEYPQKAMRPKNSKMSKEKLNSIGLEMPTWESAIDRYNVELKELNSGLKKSYKK